jgi:hypothetical protein
VVHASFDWNWNSDFPLAKVYHDGTDRHILNANAHSEDTANKTRRFLREVLPLARTVGAEGGGLVIADIGGQDITLTAGKIWHGFNEYDIAAVDTSIGGAPDVTNSFTAYYRATSAPLAWTSVADQVAWDNTQYDDGTGLSAVGVSKWANLWWYVDAEDGDLIMLYGRGQYNTLALALLEAIPNTTPGSLSDHSRLLGRFIFQNGAGATVVQNTADTQFQSEGVTAHSDLTGLTDDDHTVYSLADGSRAYTGDVEILTAAAPTLHLQKTSGLGSYGGLSWEHDNTGWEQGFFIEGIEAAGANQLEIGWNGILAGRRGWFVDETGNWIPFDESAMPGPDIGTGASRVDVLYVATIDATDYGLSAGDIPALAYDPTGTAAAAVAVHTGDADDAHDASAISILDTADDFTATDVEGALAELQADAEAHLSDATDAHDASAISILDTADDFTATDVEGALAELQADNEAHVVAADPHTGYILESLLDAAGDIIYASADNTPARLGVGSNGDLLTLAAGLPSWAAAPVSTPPALKVFMYQAFV